MGQVQGWNPLFGAQAPGLGWDFRLLMAWPEVLSIQIHQMYGHRNG